MAAPHSIDIACGVNFKGQYVDCITNPPLQRFLVPFINGALALCCPEIREMHCRSKWLHFVLEDSHYWYHLL
jgi:hypothetical protein